jgi:hypothetical protein
MIALLISIGIIVGFASQAKKNNKNPIKWAVIGLLSFWITTIIPVYILVEYVIGKRNDNIGIVLITGTIFTFFTIGAITCDKVYKHLKKN